MKLTPSPQNKPLPAGLTAELVNPAEEKPVTKTG